MLSSNAKRMCNVFAASRVGSIEIKGRMAGEIVADGIGDTSTRMRSLEGNVTAKAITVEKGGTFSGQLVIGQADLQPGRIACRSGSSTVEPTDEYGSRDPCASLLPAT